MRAAYLLLLAITAAAQQTAIHETEAARARQLLSAPGWQDKAWGAYFAGRLHAEEFTSPLVEALREATALRDAPKQSDPGSYLITLFDALIENRVAVPPEVLEPFEVDWKPQVIILLSRGKDTEEALLRLRHGKLDDPGWLAVSNLLAELPSQRFFQAVVREITPTSQFVVVDPNSGGGSGGGVYSGLCGDSAGSMARDFPPAAVYGLTNSAEPGDVMLARGPQDVFYRRFVMATNRQAGIGHCFSPLDRQELLAKYLSPLGNASSGETLRLFHRDNSVTFRGTEDFQQQVESALQAQESAIRQFLQTTGIDCAGLHLKIEPKVVDLRKTTAGSSLEVAPRELVWN